MDTVFCALLALNSNVIKVVIGELGLLGPIRNACVGGGKGGGRGMPRVHCPTWQVFDFQGARDQVVPAEGHRDAGRLESL